MKSIRYYQVAGAFLFSVMGFLSQAQAATYDLKQMTPEVEAAIAGRQSRYAQLQSEKASGVVGENNHGYVEALNGTSSLVGDENKDRKMIYQTIAEQNNLGASGLEVVEKVFAEVQRDKARPGDSMQTPEGQWVKK